MRDVTQLSDQSLLERYQQADAAAFDEFFRRHKTTVFGYLMVRLRDRAEAEEAFQRTFLRIHKYILNYDPQRSALGWVMGIARNTAYDCHAARSKALALVQDLDPVCPASSALEARSALSGIMANLAPADRRLLERRFFCEESFSEIAGSEGWSVDNTRQRISRLMRRLRAHFSDSAP